MESIFAFKSKLKNFMRYQYLDKDSTYLGVYLCASQNPFIRYVIFCIIICIESLNNLVFLRDVKIDYDLVIFDQLGLSNSFVFSK